MVHQATGHDAGKSAQNLASRHDKGAIPHHIGHDAKKTSKNLASRHERRGKVGDVKSFGEDRNVKRMVRTKTFHGFTGKAWKSRRVKWVSATVYQEKRGRSDGRGGYLPRYTRESVEDVR